jgi:hypothetical protein
LQSEEKNSSPFAQEVNSAQTKQVSALQNEFLLFKGNIPTRVERWQQKAIIKLI